MIKPAERRRLAVIASAVVLLLSPAAVTAHADLVSSEPADGATVVGPSVPIVVAFDEPLADGSEAELVGPAGPVATFGRDDADPTRMALPGTEALVAGDYEIRWTSISDDGDIERGTISFTVTSPSPTVTLTPTTPPEGDGAGGAGLETILVILAAIVIVGVLGFRFLRRGAATP